MRQFLLALLIVSTAFCTFTQTGQTQPADDSKEKAEVKERTSVTTLKQGESAIYWFRATDKSLPDRGNGWASERWERLADEGFELTRVLYINDPDKLQVSQNYTVELSNSFAVEGFEYKQVSEGVSLELTLTGSDDRYSVNLFQGTNVQRAEVEDPRQVTLLPVIGRFLFARNELYSTGETRIKVYNPNPTSLIDMIVDLTVEVAKDPMQGEDILAAKQQYLLTFDEPGRRGGGRKHMVTVDNQGFPVQWTYETPKVTVDINSVASEEDARGGDSGPRVYALARRDPFNYFKVLHRRSVGPGPSDGGETDTRKPSELLMTEKMAQELLDQIERLFASAQEAANNENRALLEERATEFHGYFSQLTRSKAAPNQNIQPFVARAKDYKQRLDQFYNEGPIIVRQAQARLDSMSRTFEDLKLAWSDLLFADLKRDLEDIGAMRDRSEIRGTPFEAEVDEVYNTAARLNQRASILQDFQSVDVQITGVIYNLVPHPTPLRIGLTIMGHPVEIDTVLQTAVSESKAIINESIYTAGQSVVALEDLKIKRIEKQQVIFDYKGEEVSRPLD